MTARPRWVSPEAEAEQWKPEENDHWVNLMTSLVAN
jgi:hypothetical protein